MEPVRGRLDIPKNVLILGLVSFFNDIASEMIYPLVPIFLTSVLGAPVSVVGLIEGIAESVASILKVISGWLSDKWHRRKPFTVAGYSLSAVSKIFFGFAYSWPIVLLGRFVDRFGKGTRTSARDALIAESSDASIRGKTFGFHRTLDTLGATIGPLLSLIAIRYLDNNLRLVFLLSFIPAFIGVVLLSFFVKEKRKISNSSTNFKFSWKDIDPSFKLFLLISVIFSLGNSSNAFIILRAQNLGLSVTMVMLVYVLFNFVYSIFSLPAGIISDKVGPKRILLTGFFLFAIIYFLFGFIKDAFFLWILFPFYGIYMALTEGVGKAYISNLVPSEKAGTTFGLYQTAIGLCAFFASWIAGLLWSYVSISAPFIFGSITAALAAFLFLVLGKKIEEIHK